jgi:hypothetical protein
MERFTKLEAVERACNLIEHDPSEWTTSDPGILCQSGEKIDTISLMKRSKIEKRRDAPNLYAMQLVEEFAQVSPINTTRMNQKIVPETTQYAIVMLPTGEREENVRQRHCAMLGLDWTRYEIQDESGGPVLMVFPSQEYFLREK